MNSLSWMIYAASVMDGLKGVFIAGAIISSLAILLGVVAFAMAADVGDVPTGSWKKPLRWVGLPVMAAIIAALTPSSSTIYLIAASEVGETVVSTPEATEMLGDLRDVIRKKLKEELSDDTRT